jgi:hypothetical protein
MKSSFLGVLRASALKVVVDPSFGGSAVSYLLDRYNQTSHWAICASGEALNYSNTTSSKRLRPHFRVGRESQRGGLLFS